MGVWESSNIGREKRELSTKAELEVRTAEESNQALVIVLRQRAAPTIQFSLVGRAASSPRTHICLPLGCNDSILVKVSL